jgi:hypothetical protein
MKMNTFTLRPWGSSFLLLLVLSLIHTQTRAQLINTNQTAATLAQTLAGPGVTVSNATLLCPGSFNGTFTGGSGNLGIDSGILLTTGMASAVTLPTIAFPGITPGSYEIGDFDPTSEHAPGDATLSAIIAHPTYDACVLSFDFVPAGDTISFRYQFGSEEYTAFTCSPFNDGFGFFLSGPGITGTVNIAKVPGTNVPVAINTINGGSTVGAFYNLANCTSLGFLPAFMAYFIDNTSGPTVGYDGLTTVLTAKSAVQACGTYHLKLAIADASDSLLSSGVFLQRASLVSHKPTILNCPGNITATGPCGVNATWTPPTSTSSCSTTTVTSTHTPGSFFPLGTTPVTYTFTNASGSSTCTFNVIVTQGTGTGASCSITVTPSNNVYTGGVPTNIYLGYGPQSATLTDNVVGGTSFSYAWTGPTSSLSCTNCQSPVFTPLIQGTYTFNVTSSSNVGCVTSCSKTFCVKDVRDFSGNGNGNGHNSTGNSNNNNYKVIVCHLPPGNPANVQMISVSINAVPAHIGNHPGDGLGACNQLCGPPVTTRQLANSPAGNNQINVGGLSVSAAPNPFNNTLHIAFNSNSTEPADITINDLTGRKVEVLKSVGVGIEVTAGANLPSGVYIIDVRQGAISKQVKVVKNK